MFIMNQRFIIRGSVSLVPQPDKKIIEFFKTNTRESHRIVLEDNLLDFLKRLNGEKTVKQLIDNLQLDEKKVINLIKFLKFKKIIEPIELYEIIKKHPFNHVLNFLADYITSEELLSEFEKLQRSTVVIFGLGAVGSWVSIQLVKTGIKNFILIDPDIVEESNLNRSFYDRRHIGKKKANILKLELLKINPKVSVDTYEYLVENWNALDEILNDLSMNSIVINCADKPNVDLTSSWMNKSCLKNKIPYIIAGGYNLHLTLLGPTILPYETACFECIQQQLEQNDNIDELLSMKKLVKRNRNIGNIAPMAVITSTFVVNETIRTILRSEFLFPRMVNRRGHFNFFTNKIEYMNFSRIEHCPACKETMKIK